MGDEFLKQSVLSAIWRPFCFRKHDSGQRSWRKSFIYKLQRNLRLTEISWANRLSACALLVVALNGISIIDLRIKQLCHYSIRVSLSMSETTISRTFQCISSSSHCYSCRLRWTESIQLLKSKEDGKKTATNRSNGWQRKNENTEKYCRSHTMYTNVFVFRDDKVDDDFNERWQENSIRISNFSSLLWVLLWDVLVFGSNRMISISK